MPALSSYPYSLLRRILSTKVHGRIANINSVDTNLERDLINSAVRVSLSDLDFRGNIREVTLTPTLSDSQFEYALPNDVKAEKIIDLRPQVTDCRGEFEIFDLLSPMEFDRRKKFERGIFTIIDNDLTRSLRVSADVEDRTQTIARFETINGDGDTWNGFGGTADSDVKTDDDDFVEGSGAVRFADTAGAADTAIGIENAGLTAFNISPFLARGSFFVQGKLDSGDTGIKQLNLRLGSDSNNFHTFTDSNQNDCSVFVADWNLVRLDASTRVTTGVPVDTAIDYAALFWSKDSGTHLDTDFAFDHLIAKKGRFYRLSYYSRFVWQDTAFALVENSTHDSHALLLQNDEVEVVMAKAAELASQYLRDNADAGYYSQEYNRLKTAYLMSNPSRSNILTSTRYEFESVDGYTSDTSNDS